MTLPLWRCFVCGARSEGPLRKCEKCGCMVAEAVQPDGTPRVAPPEDVETANAEAAAGVERRSDWDWALLRAYGRTLLVWLSVSLLLIVATAVAERLSR